MKYVRAYIVSLFLLLHVLPVFAWGPVGHMVVASIAYQNLTPAARAKVDSLIPFFHKEYANIQSFSEAAYWPDTLKRQKIDAYGHWHYIDLTYDADGSAANKNLVDDDNAVWAMQHIQSIVQNDKANPYERVRFLAFLAHIVGDLHQPLHTATYVSVTHPEGDKGGNEFIVRWQNKKRNLHSVWDSGVGEFDNDLSAEHVAKLVTTITTHYPITFFSDQQIKNLHPEEWAQEGLKDAKQTVYNTKEKQILSPSYIANGQALAEQKIALAGYRLAVLLNQLLN